MFPSNPVAQLSVVVGDVRGHRKTRSDSATTYPFKDELKKRGFKFEPNLNGMMGLNVWIAPKDDVEDEDELTILFEEHGFPVEKCDGIAEDEDDEDDDE